MCLDDRYRRCVDESGKGELSQGKRELELNPECWRIGHVAKEERALQIHGLDMSRGMEVRNKERNGTGFIARKDEPGRARVDQPWRSWRLSWELMVDRMWQGESFWLEDRADGGANKRRAKHSQAIRTVGGRWRFRGHWDTLMEMRRSQLEQSNGALVKGE